MTVVAQFLSNAFVHGIGWFLLHVLWQDMLIAVLLAALLALVHERAATVRHALSLIALVLMLVLPVMTAFGQGPVPGTLSAGQTMAGAAVGGIVGIEGIGGIAKAGTGLLQPVSSDYLGRLVMVLSGWVPWFVPVWLAGVCVLTIRTFGGWWLAREWTKTGLLDVPAPVYRSFVDLKRRFGVTGEVLFRQSSRAEVPAVIGYFRPVLLLPVSAVSGLSAAQLECVIAHELAHIRRHDYLINVFQQFAEILLFFHPAVWWVSGQIRREREHCCDDLAVLACGDVLSYTSALLNLEEHRPVAAPRLAVTATGGNLLERVRRLLGRTEWQPGTRTALVPLVLATVFVSLVAVSAQLGTDGTRQAAAANAQGSQPRQITPPPPADDQIALFDRARDLPNNRKLRQEIISRISGSTTPEAWAKLLAIAESDPDLEVRKTAISYVSGRPDVDTLSKLYDKADRRDMKLYLMSYIHGVYNDASHAKLHAIAKSDPDRVVRAKALDYLSGR
jgi:beta-lactamase regulating signal transducer with metallopeptidase domain